MVTEKVHPSPTQFFCSQESLDAGEQLAGSAPRAAVWFLLEYPGRWGTKALKESSIPDEVKAHLNAQLDKVGESRLLLIKQSKTTHTGIAFFAALPKANPPTLYRFELTKYEELLDFDFAALAASDSRYASAISNEPVFVMCTNGLRDQCCALHGVATYWALAERFPGRIWESTHHGGHRFAANCLHLPYAISYGRLRPETASAVLETALDGRVSLASMRGRTIYPEPVQAAELLLRQQLGLDELEGIRLQIASEIEPGRWQVIFEHAGSLSELQLQEEESDQRIHISCGDEKTSPMVSYRLLGLKTA